MGTHIDQTEMKKRLTTQREVLVEQIERERRKAEPSLMTNPNRADLASDYANLAYRTSLLEQLEGQLEEVNKALERIDDGTYGWCTKCGKAILTERLEALPYAALCIDCQRLENVV